MFATPGVDGVEFARDASAGERGVRNYCRAFLGGIVDHVAEAPTVGVGAPKRLPLRNSQFMPKESGPCLPVFNQIRLQDRMRATNPRKIYEFEDHCAPQHSFIYG